MIFNMNPGKPTAGWNQIMSLPRRLTVTGDSLFQEPAGDIESLRGAHTHVERILLPPNEEVLLDTVSGNTIEMIAEIDPKSASSVEVNVLRSPHKEEFTRIAFYKDRGYRDRIHLTNKTQSQLSIDTTYSSVSPDVRSRAPETAQFMLDEGEMLSLRIFIDKSVVEVFVNGKQCLATRVYPDRPDSVGISLRAQGQSAELRSVDLWQMKPIYGPASQSDR